MELFKLREEIRNIFDDENSYGEDGQLTESALTALNGLYGEEKKERLRNIVMAIKNRESDAIALKMQEDAFYKRRKKIENSTEQLKEYAKVLLLELDTRKESFTEGIVKLRASEKLVTEDDIEVSDDFYRIKKELNKEAIKAAIKAGEIIKGARLEKSDNLQIQ